MLRMAHRSFPKISSTGVLYVAIFLDLLGFGMLIPDIQLRAEQMGAPGWLIGAVLASTFLIQVPVSPLWGKLSDRVGRKPIFLACTCFSASGMFVYAVAGAVPLLIGSRVLSGLGGANVAMAQAMLADGSKGNDRVMAMGRISASVSLGLVAGPVLGGFVAGGLGSEAVGWIAGACSATGALLVLLFLPGEPRPTARTAANPVSFRLGIVREIPAVRSLVVVAAVSWFALAMLEGTFGRLIEHTLGFGQSQFGIVFGYESMIGFAIQAWLVGWISRKVTESRLLRTSYMLQGVGLALTPFTYLTPFRAAWLGVLLFCSTLYACGSALANPTINSLCSELTPDDRQGELFGLLQGTRSIGFIVGPVLGGALFDRWFAAPYLLAGLTCATASALLGRLRLGGANR